MNENISSYIKIEEVDMETVMLDQELLRNPITSTTSKCTFQKDRSPTISDDVGLPVTEDFSGSIYRDFECKDDPLQVDFHVSSTGSAGNDATNINQNLRMSLDYKIQSVNENEDSMPKNCEGFINVQYPLYLKKEFIEQPSPQLLVETPAISIPLYDDILMKMEEDIDSINQVSNSIRDEELSSLKESKSKYYKSSKQCEINLKNPKHRSKDKHTQQGVKSRKIVKNECKPKYKFKEIHKKCSHCHFIGRKSYHAHEHIMATHDKIRPYRCKLCEYSVSYSTTFKRHLVKMHRNTYVLLDKHAKIRITHMPGNITKIGKYCQYCDFIGQYSNQTHLHIVEVHDKLLQNCPYCDLQGRIANKKVHILNVHDRILPSCPYCDFKGRNVDKKLHIMNVHDQILQSCPFCVWKGGSTYKAKHIKTIHDQIKPFNCKFCDYSTTEQYRLEKHNTNMHTDKKVYFWGKAFD